MSFLNLHGGSGSDEIVERLVQEQQRRSAKSVGFDAVDVDEAILQTAVLLFRDRKQQHHQQTNHEQQQMQRNPRPNTPTNQDQTDVKLEKLCINNCPANPYLEYLIEAAMGMDLFEEFELQGNLEEELMNTELEAERQREVAYAAQREREQRAQDSANEEAEEDDQSTPSDTQPTVNELAVVQVPQEDDNGGGGEGEDDNENGNEDSPSPASNIFALDALGFRMRFSRRLRKLELVNLPITRDHAESLMYGIETNTKLGTGSRLETLVMEGVGFVDDDEEGEENDEMEQDETNVDYQFDEMNDEEVDGMPNPSGDGTIVVKEFCEGFPNNRTLKQITLQRCSLTDAQIALIFDSLAHHPTLTSINISENACRKLGLEALDRMLVSPQWMTQSEEMLIGSSKQQYSKIETLDLGYQFTSEENYGTGEHIELDLLTRNCTTQDADIRIYPNLRKLVLQGNQIFDSDMKALAFLVRHRFPRLEELDLRFNEITTEGLELFANHSDPNNDDFYRSSFDENGVCNDTASFRRYNDRLPPPSSRLRTIRLTNNPLAMNDQASLVILKLLKIYPELQQIQSNLSWEDGTPVAAYIQHLLDINRGGRVLLLAGSSSGISSSNLQNNLPPVSNAIDEHPRRRQLRQQQLAPIPMAAWPLVLGRLTRLRRYPHYVPKKNCVNSMYYLIRHGPIIMEQLASRPSAKVSPSSPKKKSAPIIKKDKDGESAKNDDNEKTSRKRARGDPALGGYATLEDFLRSELGIES